MQYDIVISGMIGGWDCLSTGYLRYLLNLNRGKDVHVAFCSLGGYVKDGLEMNQLFKDHGKVHAHAFGMNASISTIAMLGCKTIDIVKGSFFLIHNTSMLILKYDQQNKEQLDEYIKTVTKQRNDLNTFDDALAQMYADKSGKTKEECAEQMKKGNWLTAQQAVDFGLVDSLREDEEDEKASVRNANQFVNLFSINNNIYEEAGIPPLPDQSKDSSSMSLVADGNGNPTQTFLQKTLQGVKNLLHLTDVNNKKKEMSKAALSRIENAVGVSGITISDDGNLTLSAEQAQKLDEALAETSVGSKEEAGQAGQATQQATGVAKELATVKDELAKARKELDEKDEQIKNLQGSTSPKDGTNGNPADQQPALTARAIADSVKGI